MRRIMMIKKAVVFGELARAGSKKVRVKSKIKMCM